MLDDYYTFIFPYYNLIYLILYPIIISVRGQKWMVYWNNPWNATTLEWNTPTPPPHGNFLTEQVVYRGPYEYSVPGADKDYSPQWEAPSAGEKKAAAADAAAGLTIH